MLMSVGTARWNKTLRRLVVPTVILIGWYMVVTAGVVHAQNAEKPNVSLRERSPESIKYMGAGSCNASGCHGLVDAKKRKFTILQNEYWLWEWNAGDQRNRLDYGHSKAFENLKTPESRQMAKHLGLKSPETEPRCLACHAVPVAEHRRGPNYELAEGVTCEGCHGAAELWLGPHTRKDWDKKKGAEYGMLDTKNVVKRAELCLRCHQGTEKDTVDHELIGAGHPRLSFELDSYSELMPVHWIVPKEEKEWSGARIWAVGQAESLHQQLELLASSRKVPGMTWPDFTFFDCYACHHDVADRVRGISEAEKKLQRWRVKDLGGKKPGRLVWNAANYTVFRHAVREILPEKAALVDEAFTKLHETLSGKPAAAEFEQTVTQLLQLTAQLGPALESHLFTQKEVWSIMRRIAGDASVIANAGFQSAEQAVLAISSLQESYSRTVGAMPNAKAFSSAFEQLNSDIVFGHKFNLVQFGQHLSGMRKLLESESPPVNGSGAAPAKAGS
jgi:Cytochrome c554 and c-prime